VLETRKTRTACHLDSTFGWDTECTAAAVETAAAKEAAGSVVAEEAVGWAAAQ
jgi:hypothetical protein